MKFGESLKAIRKEKKVTQVELAKMCNVSQGTIANWESGVRTPDIETIAKIAELFGVTTDSLLRESKEEEVVSNAEPLPAQKVRMVPLFESVSAGFGADAQNRVIDFMPLFIESDSEAASTICVRVCGDSMHPKIEDGDIVQVLKRDTADTGDIVVILDGDDAYVKRFIHSRTGVILESLNPAYPPMKYTKAESNELRIVGIVKRIVRDL